MSELVQKILDYALKAVATLLVSGTGYQLFDGRWFGRHMFDGLLQREDVQMLTPPQSTEVFGLFGGESLAYTLGEFSPPELLLGVVLLLVLIAHVLLKPSLDFTLDAMRAAASSQRSRLRRTAAFVARSYLTFYHVVTVLLFLGLTAAFLLVPLSAGLVVLLVLVLIPGALYLVAYSKDALSGRFVERYTYLSLLLLLVVSLVSWPARFGARVFDPSFPVISELAEVTDRCDRNQFLPGPTFIAMDRADERLAFRLCFHRFEQRMYLDFFQLESHPFKSGIQRLSQAVRDYVPPEHIADPHEAFSEVQRQFNGQ